MEKNPTKVKIAFSSIKYLLGLSIIILSDYLFRAAARLIQIKGDDDIVWNMCPECSTALTIGAWSLIILGIMLIILYTIDKATDYLPIAII